MWGGWGKGTSLVLPSRVSLGGGGHPCLPLRSCLQGPLLVLLCFPASELVSVPTFLIFPFSWDLGNSWDGLSCEDEAKYSHKRKQCEAVGSTDTRETYQDKQTQKSLGRYRARTNPQAGTMGQPSIRPLVSLSCLLSAGHTLPCAKPVPFSIYHRLWAQQGRGRWTRSIPHWRGDQSIP